MAEELDLTPGEVNISLTRGDTLNFTAEMYEDEDQTAPLDLASADIAIQVRDTADAATGAKILEYDNGAVGGITVDTSGDANVFEWTAPATDTDDLTTDVDYYYDIQITVSGVVRTYIKGTITTEADVTEVI